MLAARWPQPWAALGARADAALATTLLARYDEPHRAYHTQQHLAECLALFDEVRDVAARPAEVEMALWFHDAIYDVHRHDNEALSAVWAQTALVEAGASNDIADRVAALVLATQHRATPQLQDEQLLVDIDLAILGAEPQRFAEYEAQIGREYAFVEPAVFAQKRAAVLTGFLARPVLYATPKLRQRFEAVARHNLATALAMLQGAARSVPSDDGRGRISK